MDGPPAALDFTQNVADGVDAAMDGPPAAFDFTPNAADGVADAAENAARAEPVPNLSPARATRGAGAVGYTARLQRTGTVL